MSESDDTPMTGGQYQKADVLLLTATEVESKAVLRLIKKTFNRDFERHFINEKTYYDLGPIGGARTYLVQSEMGGGGLSGSLLTVSKGIEALSPFSVVMLGIAFGVNPEKQRIGQILVAKQIVAYELQRVGSDADGRAGIVIRGDRPQASPKLLDRFRSGVIDWPGAKVDFGLILSGDKLIDNKAFKDELRAKEPEAIGGEMEGGGLYAAAQSRGVDWILVKAICDWADGEKHVNKQRNQQKAALNAAKFTLHVIQQGGFSRKDLSGAPGGEKIPESGLAPEPLSGRAEPVTRNRAKRPKRNRAASYGEPPFHVEDFAYELPARLSSDPSLVPVPATAGQTGLSDAFDGVAALILNHFETRRRQRQRAHEVTWREACDYVADAANKRRLKGSTRRSQALNRYRETLHSNLAAALPLPLWLLVTGDTGAGKTTLVRGLARSLPRAVLIDLRDYSASQRIFDVLADADASDVGFARGDSEPPRILILDALDKMVPGATYQVTVENLREIRASATPYHVVIITARTTFFRTHSDEQLRDAKVVRLLPLRQDNALLRSEMFQVRPEFSAALQHSEAIRDMAGKPLLLDILLQMLRDGQDITMIEDQEDLFAYIVDSWLVRDAPDAITSSAVRLKCMQCLALHFLSTGGTPITYSAIDSLITKMFDPLPPGQLERFNTDLRVCGFLRRLEGGNDTFEFQHAAFYEYCIARSVFEDLRNGDFDAVGSHSFTEDIIDFITRRAKKTSRTEQLAETIRSAWDFDLTSTARANLMKLYMALRGNCDALSLDNITIEAQNLSDIKFPASTNTTFYNATFRDCVFINVDFGKMKGEQWVLENCSIRQCSFKYARFDASEFRDTHWAVEDGSYVHFFVCHWEGGAIEASDDSEIIIDGGRLEKCTLSSVIKNPTGRWSGPKTATIRFAELDSISLGVSLATWRIEMCSIDGLSLYGLASLDREARPGLSREIQRMVNAWLTDPTLVKPIIYPYVKTRDATHPSVTKSQARKFRRRLKKLLGLGGNDV
jgi:nucleoside phosphorylase